MVDWIKMSFGHEKPGPNETFLAEAETQHQPDVRLRNWAQPEPEIFTQSEVGRTRLGSARYIYDFLFLFLQKTNSSAQN